MYYVKTLSQFHPMYHLHLLDFHSAHAFLSINQFQKIIQSLLCFTFFRPSPFFKKLQVYTKNKEEYQMKDCFFL